MTIAWPSESNAATLTQPAVWLGWDHYLAWLSGRMTHVQTAWGERVKLGPPWQPGEHDAMVGPTGEGKSTYAVGRLGLRNYVMALDPKGEDETLTASGFARVRSIYRDDMRWRLRNREDAKVWDQVWRNVEDGRPAKVIVGGGARSEDEVTALRLLMREAVSFCRFTRGWTLYVDEFEIMTSQEIYNLRAITNEMLISARRAGISLMTSYQAQAWVSKHAIRQSRRAIMWPTGDPDMIKAVAQGMGRDWRPVKEAVELLPPWHTLTIPRGKHHPMVITSAPQL